MNRTRRLTIGIGAALLALLAALALQLRRAPSEANSSSPSRAAAQLSIQVTTATGAPAVGARVLIAQGQHQAEQATDARGSARFIALLPGEARMSVSVAGSARAQRTLKLTLGENRESVPLLLAARLDGIVVDDAGNPIAGAELEVQSELVPTVTHAARSDAQGHFALAELGAGRYALRARAPNHELSVIPAVELPIAEPLRLVLERTSSLRGAVRDARGAAAAGATVIVAGSGVWPPRELTTDTQGRFELTAVPPGVYELRARSAGDVSKPREGVIVEPAAVSSVELQLEPGASVRGRVFEAATGQALPGVTVRLIEDALTGASLTAASDAEGAFELSGLRAAPHRLFVAAPGFVAITGRAVDPAVQSAPIALGLRRAATLSGQVRDEQGAALSGVELEVVGTSESGEPVHVLPEVTEPRRQPLGVAPPPGDNLGVTVGAIPKIPLFAIPSDAVGSEPSFASGFASDEAGNFRIAGVPAGRIEIVARRAGFAPLRSGPVVVAAGAAVDWPELVLSRGAELLGRVVDAAGYPVAGLLVQLEVASDPAARATLTAEDGRFRFDALRGRCAVTARPAQGPPVREQVDLRPGERRELVLTLGGEGRALTGRVFDPRGFPVEAASVRVTALSARSPVSRSAVSGRDGTFQISALPDPPYSVAVEHPDYAPTRVASVSPALDAELKLELRPGARVYGLVLDRLRNEGIDGARVQLRGEGASLSARSDAQGRFEFRNIIIGNYEIIAEHEGYITARARVPVPIAEAREVDPLVLGPGGTVSGDVVDRLGAPVFDAEVAIGDPPVWRRASRTDHRGHFSLGGIEPGDHRLSARHPEAGETPVAVPVRVYPLQESPGVVLRLPDQPGGR